MGGVHDDIVRFAKAIERGAQLICPWQIVGRIPTADDVVHAGFLEQQVTLFMWPKSANQPAGGQCEPRRMERRRYFDGVIPTAEVNTSVKCFSR